MSMDATSLPVERGPGAAAVVLAALAVRLGAEGRLMSHH
jgi:hypothetical protein